MTLTSTHDDGTPRHVTAKAANGPALCAWLEEMDVLEVARLNPTHARRIFEWRKGGWADFYAVDRILIACHLHPADVPEHIWSETGVRLMSGVCPGCGKKFESLAMGAPRKWCSARCKRAGTFRKQGELVAAGVPSNIAANARIGSTYKSARQRANAPGHDIESGLPMQSQVTTRGVA